ncbi:Cna B-type domain-containing protein, partial [Granulicatella balaenopterae]|uniref:Cna B-type domain-containing protein n=1 Tax=Granulicatella balaenopterae TaxID=137733 RepID=UPI0038991748
MSLANKETAIGEVPDLAIRITNKQAVRNLEVTKSWQDAEGNALDEKYIPESITVNLLANGTKVEGKTLTITKEDDWKGQFENLPIYDKNGQEIVYSVEEVTVPGFTTTISQATEKEAAEGEVPDLAIRITNKQKVRNLEVTKDWQDAEGNALDETYIPESITVNLFEMIDGQKQPVMDDEGNQRSITIKADTDGNWKGTFENLPVYDKDGKDIVYSVEEDEVKGFTTTIVSLANKETAIGEVPDLAIRITNKQAVRNLEVTKDWQDAEGNALDEKYILESITVNLFEMIDGQKQPVMDDEGNQRSITIKADTDGNWKGTFENLPVYDKDGQEIVYSVEEVIVPGFTTHTTGDSQHGFIITNTQQVIAIPVEKHWIGKPAEEVVINLLADGKATDKQITLNATTSWQGEFNNLVKYDSTDGHEINYKVEEVEIDGYTSSITEKGVGYIITNTNTATISIPVEKHWIGEPADSVTINLLADGKQAQELTLNASNNWKAEFNNLPVYNQETGKEITYSIGEVNIDGYTSAITG